jgi:hypothetical protein
MERRDRTYRIPPWSIEEFKALLDAGNKAPVSLVDLLPLRTPGEIGSIQQAIHAYHRGKEASVLSRLMVEFLERKRGHVVCPVCVKIF